MNLLKGKATKEVKLLRSIYGPLRTDSLLLDSVRAINFSVHCIEILVMFCPKELIKYEIVLGSHQNKGVLKPLISSAHAGSREKEDGGACSGDREGTNDRNPSQSQLLMNYIIWNVRG